MSLTIFYEFTDKPLFKNPKKNIALANLNIYYTWKNIKCTYNNRKVKISAPTWNDEFDLNDEYDPSDHTLFQIFKTILNTLLNTSHYSK